MRHITVEENLGENSGICMMAPEMEYGTQRYSGNSKSARSLPWTLYTTIISHHNRLIRCGRATLTNLETRVCEED